MIYAIVPQDAVPGAWDGLWRLLEPAAAQDTTETEASLYAALCEGRMTAWLVSGEAAGVLVTRVDEDDGVKTARLRYAAGRAALSHMNRILADFEDGARQIGCEVSRIGGRRGWLRIADGYEVMSDADGHVELVKRL